MNKNIDDVFYFINRCNRFIIVLIWGPVLVKIILIIFTETELVKLFVQLILWCRLNNCFYSPNYFYVLNILFFTSSKSWINFTRLRFFHFFHQLFFPVHEFLSKSRTTLRADCNPITPHGDSNMAARSVVVRERNERGFRNFLQNL